MKVLKCISSRISHITVGKTYICFERYGSYFFMDDDGHITSWGKNQKCKFTMIDVVEERDDKLNELLK